MKRQAKNVVYALSMFSHPAKLDILMVASSGAGCCDEYIRRVSQLPPDYFELHRDHGWEEEPLNETIEI